jgi:hypothetical protein
MRKVSYSSSDDNVSTTSENALYERYVIPSGNFFEEPAFSMKLT